MGGPTKRKSLAVDNSDDSDDQPISKKPASSKSKSKRKSAGNDEPSSSKPPRKTIKKPKINEPEPESSDGNAEEDEIARPALIIKSNMEGEKYLELGKKKRATVRAFKGATLVDIREFYGEEGDEKPGKKGISLSVDQWKALMEASPAIDKLIARMK